MPARLLLCLLAFLAAIFAQSCISLIDSKVGSKGGSGPGGQPSSSGPSDPLSRADSLFGQSQFAQAASIYRDYLSQNPQSPRREEILAKAGEAADRAGDHNAAASAYAALISQYPSGPAYGQAAVRLPELLLAMGRLDEAINEAQALYPSLPDGPLRAASRLSAAKALWASGRYLEAVPPFLEAREKGAPDVRQAAESGLEGSLFRLSQNDLNQLARQYGQNYPGPEAVWHMAYLSLQAGDRPTFRAQAEYFRKYFSGHPWTSRLEALEKAAGSLPLPPGASYQPKASELSGLGLALLSAAISPGSMPGGLAVAAILPLSGDGAARFAMEALNGLKLALGSSGGRISVVEMDTGGDSGTAARLIQEAAGRPEILAAVGPIGSPESLAAAQVAQTSGLPLLAISQRLGLTDSRPWVFRVFLTPKHQAEAVARYAVTAQGHARLAVLYPSDQYGQAMLGFFRAEASRLGAAVSLAESYDPQSKNWEEAVTRLTGGQSVRRASTSYQAPTDFTALYIPDSAPAVAQILPIMAFHDVTRMQYLGSPLWLTPELPQSSGRYLSGAVIPSPFSPLSQRPEAQGFAGAYQAAYGRPPDQFAAYGYDAGLALMAAISGGAADRAGLVRVLGSIGQIPGATGPFSFSPEGDYQVEPSLVTVEGAEFKLLRDSGPFLR
jgi:branched-chain amino acid transport system substrate-binding protein